MLTMKQKFGFEPEPGRFYGYGNIRSRLIPHEFRYEVESGDLEARVANSNGDWQKVYAQDSTLKQHLVPLNDDLSEMFTENWDTEDSIEKMIDWAESRVLTLRAELQAVEDKLCDKCGVSKGDDSDVANAIFDLVWNSGPARIVLESMPAKAA
jgi:hypothetical protein